MKNLVFSLFMLVILFAAFSCTTDAIIPAISIEKHIVISPEDKSNLPNTPYQIDTIIAFNPKTMEETIKVVKYQIDTIITFDSETYEETIQIVKTEISSQNLKND